MLRVSLFVLGGLVLLVVLALAGLSVMSRRAPTLGTVEGQLRPCPGSPNCVSSERPGRAAYVEPLEIEGSPDQAWERAREVVQSMGGEVREQGDAYLRATFRTPVFRFVDDLELRLAPDDARIHVRSASRVGQSDLGANRKRVERLRERFSRGGSSG